MKTAFFINILLLALFISGCSQKEIVTLKYYDKFSKDDVLLAGKRAFITAQDDKYVIDSYRDRLEVTKIDTFYHLVGSKIVVKEYLLEVEEDDLGTLAKMTVIGYYDPDKKGKYYVDKDEHNFIWEKMDFFLAERDSLYLDAYNDSKKTTLGDSFKTNIGGFYEEKIIKPSKFMKANQEFENGVIECGQKDTVESDTIIEKDDELNIEEIGHDEENS
ncbi:MAG: hypothetical protein RBR23_00925 [Arcobacteraceae bacterium]|jgi:hypothetical protein|nr:hypothetical protein [Arcobacteraceae bacterium]